MRTQMESVTVALRLYLMACATSGAICAGHVVHAAPPVLAIASEPLTSVCRPDATGQLDGPALVRVPAKPDQTGSLYQSSMDLADWSGRFSRYSPYVMVPGAGAGAGAGGASPAMQPAWEAGALLTGSAGRAPSPSPARRNIYTASVQSDGTLTMVPFEWDALTPEQRVRLDPASDGNGPQRLAWLRGERRDEGTQFRTRSSILGNAVHSTPVYVGPSPQKLAPARPDMLYLGANDGMLHAFSAADGAELFAYVPAALFDALHLLAAKDYVHRAYVDGPAQAGEVVIAGSVRTVLVSAMGGGAQAVFALDVTDPARFAEHGVLWEFTDRHDALMGNVTSVPQLAKLRVGMQGSVPVYRHFAVVASGFNNYADDGAVSPSGDGALLLLALDKPRTEPWRLNHNYYRLLAPVADATLANALQAPVIVADHQGAARYAYAGDLQGNLWRFDLAAGPPWTPPQPGGDGARLSSTVSSSQRLSSPVTLLFTARDAQGQRQPIAQQPQLAYADGGGYLVLFGTGKLIEQADRSAARFAPQTYYAIRDSLQTPPQLVTRRQLARRVLSGDPAADRLHLDGAAMQADNMGWYLDLLASATTGERSLDSGVLMKGALAFNTMLPVAEATPAGAACTPAHSRTYVLNPLTGLATGQSVSARLPPMPTSETPVVAERSTRYAPRPQLWPVATTESARAPTGRVRIDQDFAIGTPGPPGQTALGTVHTSQRAGRLSWREVANWRQLHQQYQVVP